MAFSIAGPSIIGIMKSSNTKSGDLLPRSSNPCWPLTAVTTSWPASAKTDWRTSATLNSSSTTRMSATLILTAMPGGLRPDRALIPALPYRLRQNLLCRSRIRLNDYAFPGDSEPVQCRVDLRVADLQHRNHPMQLRAELDIAHHQDDFGNARDAPKRKTAKRQPQHGADQIGFRRIERADAAPAEFAAEGRKNMAEAVRLGSQPFEPLKTVDEQSADAAAIDRRNEPVTGFIEQPFGRRLPDDLDVTLGDQLIERQPQCFRLVA